MRVWVGGILCTAVGARVTSFRIVVNPRVPWCGPVVRGLGDYFRGNQTEVYAFCLFDEFETIDMTKTHYCNAVACGAPTCAELGESSHRMRDDVFHPVTSVHLHSTQEGGKA
eukprot:1178307-Prorocentrum_minimum.AAC.3